MRPLTQEVLTLALASYRAAPQPAALDLSKQFFIMYGREEGMVAPLRSLLTDQADLIDSFYSMLSQVLKKQAGLFLHQSLPAGALLGLAIQALAMPEQHPVKATASFLTQLVGQSSEVESPAPLVTAHGEQLFMAVIKCVGGAASRSYIDYFTDILLALNKKYFDNLCRYMNTMVNT